MGIANTLIRPIVTEKSSSQLGNDRTYTFEVGIDSNKHQIQDAVESFYGVQVDRVRTMIVRGKLKRHGRHYGKRKNWKKAYVTLSEGNAIDLYEA